MNGRTFHSYFHTYAQKVYAQRLQSNKLPFLAPTKTSLSQSLINTSASKDGFVAKYAKFIIALGSLTFGEFCLLRSWSIHQNQYVHSEGCHKHLENIGVLRQCQRALPQ